jgi:hypothetical protein
MNYRILLLRLLANLNIRRVFGSVLGFFVYTVGAATDNVPLLVAGLTICIIEIWDWYEDKS